jgi:hypothetical protein
VQIYSDENYTSPVGRVHLEWTDVGAGQGRVEKVYFRVTKELRDADIVHYGLYGVVVPEGHNWDTLNWTKDKGPQ